MAKQPRSKKKFTESELLEIDEVIKTQLSEKTKNVSSKGGFHYKTNIKFKTEKQKDLYLSIKNSRLTFANGAAGTGKTMISILCALDMLKEGNIKKIILCKPIVEASSPLGFLPGTIQDKVSVYMHSFYDNIEKIIGKEMCKSLKDGGFIKEVPLNYVRGNTLGHVDTDGNVEGYFCILDETQNATVKDLKLFISRLGEKSVMCILGDSEQTDLKLRYNETTSLDDAFERFKDLDGVSLIKFDEDDIVRDPFLKEVMKRYKTKE